MKDCCLNFTTIFYIVFLVLPVPVYALGSYENAKRSEDCKVRRLVLELSIVIACNVDWESY